MAIAAQDETIPGLVLPASPAEKMSPSRRPQAMLGALELRRLGAKSTAAVSFPVSHERGTDTAPDEEGERAIQRPAQLRAKTRSPGALQFPASLVTLFN